MSYVRQLEFANVPVRGCIIDPDVNAWNHISNHPNLANNTISRQKRGITSTVYSFLFGPTEI